MKRNRILIVDDNVEWCKILAYELAKYAQFEVLPPIHTGQDALNYMAEHRPEIILLDILIPVCDGFYILNYIREKMRGYNPFIYILSAIGVSKTASILQKLEVDFCSVKPIKASVVANNLCNLIGPTIATKEPERSTTPLMESEYKELSLNNLISDYLYEIGAPMHLLSTNTARCVLKWALLNEANLNNLTDLYTLAAKEDSKTTTPGAIERNLRSMIANIHKSNNAYYQACFFDQRKKVTNAMFIYTSVTILRKKIEEILND